MLKKLTKMTVFQLSEGLKDKVFSAEEVTKAYIETIHEKEKTIQAFITVTEDIALSKAREIDRKRIKGEHLSSIAGIPMGIKDNICTKDILTTCGSKMLKNYLPTHDSTVVNKLSNQGAVLLGKLNMDEFGIGSTTESSAYKTTANPVNTEYVPGGSSGGSAAAVASQEVAFSLGSDTGGSIRQPASFCGVVGIKPTYGTVSRYGLVAYASSLDHVGPITKDVRDAAFIMNYIVGADEKDPTTIINRYPDYLKNLNEELNSVKIGICKEFFTGTIDEEVKSAVLEATRVFERLGIEVVQVSLSSFEHALAAYEVISSVEASSNLARFDGVRYGLRANDYSNIEELYQKSRGEGFGEAVKTKILLGTHILSSGYYKEYYQKAQQAKKIMIEEFRKLFLQCNAILGPVTPTTAYKLGERSSAPQKLYYNDNYTAIANLTGLPAISIPCGKDSAGLPIGMQLIGSYFNEDELLHIAYAFEQEVNAGGCNNEFK